MAKKQNQSSVNPLDVEEKLITSNIGSTAANDKNAAAPPPIFEAQNLAATPVSKTRQD
ncbi:MAG: hypothetical protein ABIO55_13870 [Ginsengibacter sp.]